LALRLLFPTINIYPSYSDLGFDARRSGAEHLPLQPDKRCTIDGTTLFHPKMSATNGFEKLNPPPSRWLSHDVAFEIASRPEFLCGQKSRLRVGPDTTSS
jgi:hypothetical protein